MNKYLYSKELVDMGKLLASLLNIVYTLNNIEESKKFIPGMWTCKVWNVQRVTKMSDHTSTGDRTDDKQFYLGNKF